MNEQTPGKTIAALRKAHGLTQQELAEKMGVTDKAVSKWERGLSCPDVTALPKLAELLGVSVDALLQGAAVPQEAPPEPRAGAPLPLIFQAVAVAMGVAVAVLATLKKIDLYSGFSMLGIGLACAGLSLLQAPHRR